MAPWDRRARRLQARIERLPTRIASAQPLSSAPNLLLAGGTTKQPWQDKARSFSKSIGVIRFSFGLTSSVVSRCPMVPERLVDAANDIWVPQADPTVAAVMRSYRNTRDTAADLVRRHAWHYQATGELLQTVEQRDEGIEWFIYSTAAAQIWDNTRPVLLQDLPGGSVFNGGAHEVPPSQVRRFWQADDDYPLLATSPMFAILDDCERYVVLGRRTKREAKSALGLNGIVFTPESAHHYPKDAEGKTALYSQMDQDLAGIAAKAWDDDDSMAAIAPYSVHYGVDDKTAIKPEWVEVGRALDPKVLEARQEALDSMMRGLPLPNVIGVAGTSGAESNHWSAWLVAEDFFKGSVAPLADQIYHGDLTGSMLRPSLEQLVSLGQWEGNPEEWRVGYDPTPVVIHPDKAGRAVELYKLGALSRQAVLLETGFSTADVPTEEELNDFIRVQQAIRTSSPFGGGGAPATVEGPPSQSSALAALAPYPSEVDAWLDGPLALDA